MDEGNLYRSDLTQYAEAIAEAIAMEESVGEETRGLIAASVLVAIAGVVAVFKSRTKYTKVRTNY